jgi:hypothetical protein
MSGSWPEVDQQPGRNPRSAIRFLTLSDETVWPTPGDIPDGDGLERRLRFRPESITRSDQLVMASIISAYRELIRCPETRRRFVVRELRRRLNGSPVQGT